MSRDRTYDFHWAAENTVIIRGPSRALETFDVTRVNYHLVAEVEDDPRKVRIREGRLEANRPAVITPEWCDNGELEGFGEEARRYFDELKEHLRIVRYGYKLKQEAFSEQVVTDSLTNVLDRVLAEVKASDDPFAAVIKGVDEPWDVCLLKFFREHTLRSAPVNFTELAKAGLFDRHDKT